MSEPDVMKASAILQQMGELCPALDDAIGDDPADICRSSFETLRRQITVTYWLVRDHEPRHFAKPFLVTPDPDEDD